MRLEMVKMQEAQAQQLERRTAGQSLAEAALFMPVILLLIAGLIEVSQLVITQNRISTAARNAARFGAQGGEDTGIRNITLNTVIQTLDLSNGVWDIFVVRGALTTDGQLPASNFATEHIYGVGATSAFTRTTTADAWTALREEIVDQLTYPGTSPANLRVVGVLILHDVETITGMNVIPTLLGRNTVRGFSIMRNSALATTVTQSTGCNGVYPLAIEENARSILREEFNSLAFTRPSSAPSYNSFSGHVENRELSAGREGYLYHLNFANAGPHQQRQVALLKWNGGTPPPPSDYLVRTLQYPGASGDPVYGYVEPGDQFDRDLHRGDVVARAPGSAASLLTNSVLNPTIYNHISTERTLRVPLWNALTDDNDDAAPGDTIIQITGFAIFRIRGYGSSGPWLLLELMRLDDSCGQPS